MLLSNKNAVIYGAGGAVGGSVARAFAREGARVFLASRTLAPLEAIAGDIARAGGSAHVAQVDALDEQAVNDHLEEAATLAGNLDISFNLIGLGDAMMGTPLVDMNHRRFTSPIETAMRAHFITATAAVRRMAQNGAGVILALTAQVARKPYPHFGGFSVAGAAIEAFCRQLATEAGPHGIRVVCLRSAGSPDTPGVAEAIRLHAKIAGITPEAFEAANAEKTLLKRLPKLGEVADVAVMMASDCAGVITGAITNVSCGEILD